ncbi:MAG: PQQ-binding-like beta-propeller repeat protein [Thermoplasmata archaeon]|nr:PQQ-binding-like beta-propeller repeat protein [Thermoplasmata archaeon]
MYKGCFSIKRKILESLLVLAIVILFIFPAVSSTSMLSFSSRDNYNIYHHQSDVQKTSWYIQHSYDESSMINDGRSPTVINKKQVISDSGPMNSSWPMYCHDTHHTGRSPYSTADNPPGIMKWSFRTNNYSLYGSSAIDANGIIYLGSGDFFALYPNGTKMWQYGINGRCESCPAIDEDGTIYIGTAHGDPNYFYAFYPNGIMKWRYYSGENILSSPVIGNDGTIYYGGESNSINALYPNGTLRWRYQTGFIVYSSPAIGDDGTIYCGCHDGYLYALYPNNGTLKWRFPTGDWIRVSPCIADDGTIYCVCTDGYLYAVHPNGTMKWRTWVEAGTSPTIGQDGTIYAGWSQLYAVNPEDGSVKWIYDTGGCIQGGTPCTSADGTIYFGTIVEIIDGYLIALNPDGTEQWRNYIGSCESAPAIGEDGTIYIGGMDSNSNGYLYAFGQGPLKAEANGPYTAMINQPVQLTGTIFGGIPPYNCHWDFGDGNVSEEQNPTHTYFHVGNYIATFTVTDSEGNCSVDTAQVTVIVAKPSVTIIRPVNGIYLMDIRVLPFSKPVIIGRITIQVKAAQEPFGIERVEFYIDDTVKATDTEAPYQWTWSTPAFFKHTIRAVAYDTSGKSTEKSIDVSKFF